MIYKSSRTSPSSGRVNRTLLKDIVVRGKMRTGAMLKGIKED